MQGNRRNKAKNNGKTAISRLLWTQTKVKHLNPLCIDVIRAVFDYLLPHLPLLIDLKPGSIRWFSFDDKVWKPEIALNREIRVDRFSRWVVLEGKSVVCSGGGRLEAGEVLDTVYEIGLEGEVQALEKMQVCRAHHGVVVWSEREMLVFGGCEM